MKKFRNSGRISFPKNLGHLGCFFEGKLLEFRNSGREKNFGIPGEIFFFIPSIVVDGIDADGVFETIHGLLCFLQRQILVAEQGVGVGECRIDLDGPLEEFQRLFAILLQIEAVAGAAPSGGRRLVLRQHLLRQGRQANLLLQMPQRRAVVLHQIGAVRLHVTHILKQSFVQRKMIGQKLVKNWSKIGQKLGERD